MMEEINVNYAKECGIIKPMHAVNNGPVYKFVLDQRITNMPAYKAAGIPYARTHDAAFCATYGGEQTDEYLRVIEHARTKTFYRLGNKIEHWNKKYGTLPPKDFKKWAVICEHIIRHYTEGWANGFYMDIEYWEIWNEPDLDLEDSNHKRCWGGTEKDFFELYDITAKHLKSCFPHLKINVTGLPAGCKAECYLLNEEHDLALAQEETFAGENFSMVLPFEEQASYLIKFKVC